MVQPTQFAFIDESGTVDLNEKSSDLFVTVAVTVNGENLEKARAAVSKIQEVYFGGAEMKSSKIANKHARRINILQKLSEIPFSYICVIVDKNEIDPNSGLQYKRSAYKYLNGLLYERMMNSFAPMKVFADEHGTPEFMKGFQSYMKGKFKEDLFCRFEHEFQDSASEVLIQVADILAGSILKSRDRTISAEAREPIRKVLQKKEVDSILFPWERPKRTRDTYTDSMSRWNSKIEALTLGNVKKFIEKHENSLDEYRKMQVAVLRRLTFLNVDHEDYVERCATNDELRDFLEAGGHGQIGKHTFSSRIIAPLRDEGVLIDGSNYGYGLTTTWEHLCTYIEHVSTVVEPMLKRLRIARGELRQATDSDLNILDESGHAKLEKLVDTFARVDE